MSSYQFNVVSGLAGHIYRFEQRHCRLEAATGGQSSRFIEWRRTVTPQVATGGAARRWNAVENLPKPSQNVLLQGWVPTASIIGIPGLVGVTQVTFTFPHMRDGTQQ